MAAYGIPGVNIARVITRCRARSTQRCVDYRAADDPQKHAEDAFGPFWPAYAEHEKEIARGQGKQKFRDDA
jgi:hypothetical protein